MGFNICINVKEVKRNRKRKLHIGSDIVRELIFISHATPNDNEFAVWLATKLELLGYKVWVDVKELSPAVDFWSTIERTIREDTIKFVFVATKESTSGNRDGVMKELAVADRIKRNIDEFIIPVRVDDMNYNDFPSEILRLNAINFNGNWAKGLADLIEYFEDQNVPKMLESLNTIEIVNRWIGLKATISNRILVRDEFYSSNLFPIELPSFIYAYKDNEVQESLNRLHISRKRLKNIVFTFACVSCLEYENNCTLTYEKIDLQKALSREAGINVIFGNEIKNFHNICTELINKSVSDFFFKRGMRRYRPGDNKNTKVVCYFPLGVKSKRNSKSREMQLSGRRKQNFWHYGLSAYFTQYPQNALLVKWHLVFTDSKGNELSDASQITARRSKGRTFFNKQWSDLLKTAIYYLAQGNNEIIIDPCCTFNSMQVKTQSISYISHVGYDEPKDEEVIDDDE